MIEVLTADRCNTLTLIEQSLDNKVNKKLNEAGTSYLISGFIYWTIIARLPLMKETSCLNLNMKVAVTGLRLSTKLIVTAL